MNHLKTIFSDARGIARKCGVLIAVRWLWCIALTLPSCIRSGNLQPADLKMGRGPFLVDRDGSKARLMGPQVFSGIREIWVRDVYLKDNYLAIPKGALVVDLGANLGNFTGLALAHHGDVRVVAVEPSRTLSDSLRATMAHNGWANRLAVKRAFLGITTMAQSGVADNPDYVDVPFVTEQAFLEEFDIRRIDFLKCDIEGSEFFMLDSSSRLLAMTHQLAIEIHVWGGSISGFLDHLRTIGFEVGSVVTDAMGNCIALCKRSASRVSKADAIADDRHETRWGELASR